MIHSWDLFDTLIGRKCGTYLRLFQKMGEIIGDPHFPTKRQAAERWFQDRNMEYSLEDIYKQYGNPNLAEIEWKLELENVFPIKRHTRYLKNEDLIVSDMYLGEKRLRELMEAADIRFSGEIVTSCYGKYSGEIWKTLKERGISHCGDNQITDVNIPARYGIRTRNAKTGMSRQELLYPEDIAWWCRRHRLEQCVDESREDKLNYLTIELNAPLLLCACHVLRDFQRYFQLGKLLFMSRDTQLMQKMFQRLYPEVDTEYVYISRECLRGTSTDFFEYLNSRLTGNTALVDLAASGGSLKAALPKLNIKNPKLWTVVFLPGFRVDTNGVYIKYVTDNISTLIDNTALEMLNYADHWHVCDVKNGVPITDQSNEYDMNMVLGYHAVFEKMLEDIPEIPIPNPQELICKILPVIHQENSWLRNKFPGHLQLERARKRKFQEAA